MNTSGQNQQTTNKPAQKRGPGVGNLVFNPGLGGVARPLAESFQMFRSLLAMLFLSSGMLDKTHPFFRPGVRFTLADIYSETRARFDWQDKSKLPQNVFFLAVWGLLGACVLWVVTLVFSLLIGTAHAAEGDAAAACLFCAKEGDIATAFIKNLIMGTQINAGEGANAAYPAGPAATGMIQAGLRAMLEFYSSAILAFASFILLYHVINMVVQAAWSGKALDGAAQIWAPLRLVLAIGLLVPISSGLNAAQFMTLKIAEMGSGIATQAWHKFGEAMTTSATPEHASASVGSVDAAAQTMYSIYACMYEINFAKGRVEAALPVEVATGIGNPLGIGNSQVRNWRLDPLWGNTVKMMVGDEVSKESCGSIVMPRVLPEAAAEGENRQFASRIGSKLDDLKAPIRNGIAEASEVLRRNMQYIACESVAAVRASVAGDDFEDSVCASDAANGPVAPSPCTLPTAPTPAENENDMAKLMRESIDPAKQKIACAVNNYYDAVEESVQAAFRPNADGESPVDQMLDIENSSWVEAGTYFMLISAVQNAITSAASDAPSASPGRVMNMTSDLGDQAPDRFDGNCDRGKIGNLFSWVLDEQKDFICRAKPYADVARAGVALLDEQQRNSGSAIQIGGLFESGKGAIINFFAGPALADPIGALFSFGHMLYLAAAALITTAIAALAAGPAVGGLLGMIPVVGGVLGGAVAGAAEAYAKLAIPLGFMALGLSFPLAFLLPILPLVRFLSAVMSWLLAIFEAVVSMPLFALAHLNPRGNSLFEPASTGYQFLFHIAVKPILLVFGMIGAILVLPIVLYALNFMFVPALDAAWGDNEVSIITKAFFFMAYATSAYGFVNISLKALDDLSQKSLRWANFQGYSFRDDSESAGHSAAAVAQYATSAAKSLTSGAQGMGKALGDAGGKGVAGLTGASKKKALADAVAKEKLSQQAKAQIAKESGGGSGGGGALPPGGGGGLPGGGGGTGPKPAPGSGPRAPGLLAQGKDVGAGRVAERMKGGLGGWKGSFGGQGRENAAFRRQTKDNAMAAYKDKYGEKWQERQGLAEQRDEMRTALSKGESYTMPEQKDADGNVTAAAREVSGGELRAEIGGMNQQIKGKEAELKEIQKEKPKDIVGGARRAMTGFAAKVGDATKGKKKPDKDLT